MILDETLELLRTARAGDIGTLTLSDVRVGLHMTAVRLSDGSTGISSTLRSNDPPPRPAERDYGEFTPAQIRGRSVLSLLESGKRSALADTLRIAALNALSASQIRAGRYRVEENTDPIDLADLLPGRNVVMVGAFQSYIRRIAGSGCRLQILEMDRSIFHDEDLHYFVPADEYRNILPHADTVIITGLTLLNGTIDGLLQTIAPGAQVIVTGPSGSVLPDVLFSHGVSIVGATRVTDPEMAFEVVGQGGAGYHLYRYAARKICILSD